MKHLFMLQCEVWVMVKLKGPKGEIRSIREEGESLALRCLITYLEHKSVNSYCIHSFCLCLFENTVPGSKSAVLNLTNKVLALVVPNFLDGEMHNRVRDGKIYMRISCP